MSGPSGPKGPVAVLLLSVLSIACSAPPEGGAGGAEPAVSAPAEDGLDFVVAGDGGEAFPALSADGQTLYYATHQAGWTGFDLVSSTWSATGWSPPQPMPFSGPDNDRAPFPSPDGTRLYFASDRPLPGAATSGDFNLWVVTRTEAGDWSAPTPVAGVNSTSDDFHPAVTADGTLYFSSDRPGGEGTFDIWRARPTEQGFAAPENLGSVVNTAGEETDVYVDPQERFLIVVATDRAGGFGGDDLWLTRAVNGGWTALENLGAPVNSDRYEYGPFVSPDHLYLYFTTHRRGLGDVVRISIDELPSIPR